MKLSVQEQNFVSIYRSGLRMATVSQLREALPYMDEHDAGIVHALIGNLGRMRDSAFDSIFTKGVVV